LDSVCYSHKNIDELSNDDVDSLTSICLSSYGDYTNILRDFLEFYYNVIDSWPVDYSYIIPRSAKTRNYDKYSDGALFNISKSLTNDCIIIKSDDYINGEILYNVFDELGKFTGSGIGELGTEICIDHIHSGLYFVNIYDGLHRVCETHKIVVP
jgi:hypothetical protein